MDFTWFRLIGGLLRLNIVLQVCLWDFKGWLYAQWFAARDRLYAKYPALEFDAAFQALESDHVQSIFFLDDYHDLVDEHLGEIDPIDDALRN